MLLAFVILCALGVISSQHHARRLFNDLEIEQTAAKKLDDEWRQLQLEQSTWATNKRVEAVASKQLGMRLPDSKSTVIVNPQGGRP